MPSIGHAITSSCPLTEEDILMTKATARVVKRIIRAKKILERIDSIAYYEDAEVYRIDRLDDHPMFLNRSECSNILTAVSVLNRYAHFIVRNRDFFGDSDEPIYVITVISGPLPCFYH